MWDTNAKAGKNRGRHLNLILFAVHCPHSSKLYSFDDIYYTGNIVHEGVLFSISWTRRWRNTARASEIPHCRTQ